MSVKQVANIDLSLGAPFLSVFAVDTGLAELCQKHAIALLEGRDELDRFRYALIDCDGIIAMVENYPRHHPDSFYISIKGDTPDVRFAAAKVLTALGLREKDIVYTDKNFDLYPR